MRVSRAASNEGNTCPDVLTPDLDVALGNRFTGVDVVDGDINCQSDTLLLFGEVSADALTRDV